MEVEVDPDSAIAGRPIAEFVRELPEGVVVGAITRDGSLITPRGDTVVEAGDHVVLFADAAVVDAIAAAI
jgi:trk system potassium uptake protein TrkA